MEYLKNEKLETIHPDWPGNPIKQGAFQYVGNNSFTPSFLKILRYGITPNPYRSKKRKDLKNWRLPIHTMDQLPSLHEDAIIWLGHATFIIQLNGKRMITDPVLDNMPMFKRYSPLPIDQEKLLGLDYILLSHDHRDHCDEKSLKKLFKYNQPAVLTSLKMSTVIGPWLDEAEIQEAGWYQRYNLHDQGIRITYLPSRHWCRRRIRDFNLRLWGSFMIETPEHVIYFGGDSGYGEHFKQIGRVFPKIDIAILGIGAYRPRFLMKESHTSPKEAKKAFEQLGAKRMIPMHYGCFNLSNEPLSDPHDSIQQAFAKSPEKLAMLYPGMILRL